MIGLSSSYFASKGFGIYDSVKKCSDLGFKLVELGAAHRFEKDVFETLRKIKTDFSHMSFTAHALFPPLEKPLWFNIAEGLTTQNKGVLLNLFHAASVIEAKPVGIHPGYLEEPISGEDYFGFNIPKKGKEIGKENALLNSHKLIKFALNLSEEYYVPFCIENIDSTALTPIYSSQKDFRELFELFPSLGFLFDLGHAQIEENVEQMLEFSSKIKEVHLHESKSSTEIHFPLSQKNPFLQKLKSIPEIKKIPLIFEHPSFVKEEEILKEKELVERTLF